MVWLMGSTDLLGFGKMKADRGSAYRADYLRKRRSGRYLWLGIKDEEKLICDAALFAAARLLGKSRAMVSGAEQLCARSHAQLHRERRIGNRAPRALPTAKRRFRGQLLRGLR
jgi:hypothetical protein